MVKAINRTKEELFEEVKGVPYELPEGWKWVKLEEVLEPRRESIKPEGLNVVKIYIGLEHIDPGSLRMERFGYSYEVRSSKNRFYAGDILYGKLRPYLNKVLVCDKDGICSTDILVLKSKKFVAKELYIPFIAYYMKTDIFLRKVVSTMSGTNLPRTSWKKIKKFPIPFPFKDGKPDLEKQKQIVERIEVLFKEIDKAIELRQKAIEETKRLFDSVLDGIFREAEEDRKNWKWVKLKDMLASLESGKRPKGGAVENGIPSIGGEHLNSNGGFNFHKMKYIPENFYKTLKKGKIQINDILVVKDGATTGKVSFVSEEFPYKKAAVNEHIFILRVKNDYVPKYVFWFLFSPGGQKEILKNFGGAAQGGINRKFVENVDIPIPITKNGKLDLQKQRQIAEYLDSIHNKIKRLSVLQSIQFEKFGQLKESILNKAFRGKLL